MQDFHSGLKEKSDVSASRLEWLHFFFLCFFFPLLQVPYPALFTLKVFNHLTQTFPAQTHSFLHFIKSFHVVLLVSVAQWRPLAGMNVTGTYLLAVLTAGRQCALSSFLLRHHKALLDPPSAGLVAPCPAGPRLHPASCCSKCFTAQP